MGKTEENLKAAFAGESQANRKYLAFAKKAEEDKLPNIAKLFRAVAEAETVHALNHLKILKMVKATKENLKSAVEGETYEFTKMYPEFIKTAIKENVKDAEISFSFANKVEKIHEELYKKTLKNANENKDIEEKEFFVCPVCGNTFAGEALDVCPICSTPRGKFKKIV